MADKYYTISDGAIESLFNELFRNLDFGGCSADTKAGNFNAMYVEMEDTGAADTEFSVSHRLDRVPVGFLCVYNNTGGVIYDSGTAWTSTTMYLKCSAANANAKLLIW